MFTLLWRMLTILPRFVIEQIRLVHSDAPELSPLGNTLLRWLCAVIIILILLILMST